MTFSEWMILTGGAASGALVMLVGLMVYVVSTETPHKGQTRNSIRCLFGVHSYNYSCRAETHSPAPIRCSRCSKAY